MSMFFVPAYEHIDDGFDNIYPSARLSSRDRYLDAVAQRTAVEAALRRSDLEDLVYAPAGSFVDRRHSFAPRGRHAYGLDYPEFGLEDVEALRQLAAERRYRQQLIEQEEQRAAVARALRARQQELRLQQEIERQRRIAIRDAQIKARAEALALARARAEAEAVAEAKRKVQHEQQVQLLSAILATALVQPPVAQSVEREPAPRHSCQGPLRKGVYGHVLCGCKKDNPYSSTTPVPAPAPEIQITVQDAAAKAPIPVPSMPSASPRFHTQPRIGRTSPIAQLIRSLGSQYREVQAAAQAQASASTSTAANEHLHALSSIRDDFQAVKALSADDKAYEEQLLKILERIDGVESDGDEEIRSVRRGLVRDLSYELDKIEVERRNAKGKGKEVVPEDGSQPQPQKSVHFEEESAAPKSEAPFNGMPSELAAPNDQISATAPVTGYTIDFENDSTAKDVALADNNRADDLSASSATIIPETPIVAISHDDDEEVRSVSSASSVHVGDDEVAEAKAIQPAVVTQTALQEKVINGSDNGENFELL